MRASTSTASTSTLLRPLQLQLSVIGGHKHSRLGSSGPAAALANGVSNGRSFSPAAGLKLSGAPAVGVGSGQGRAKI